MRRPYPFVSSRIARLLAAAFATAALAACGGGGSGSGSSAASGGGGEAGPGGLDCTEVDCRPAVQGMLAGLINQRAIPLVPVNAPQARADAVDPIDGNGDGDDTPAITDTECHADFDSATFAVAADQDDSILPGELIAAFPNSSEDLVYDVSLNCTTGEVSFDNRNGDVWTLNAYDEASAFQEVDHAAMGNPSKARYTYVRFDPTKKANAINKDVLLSHRLVKQDGTPYPQPGLSLKAGTHWEACPGDAGQCDDIMLLTNPGVVDELPADVDGDGIPAALGGQQGVTGVLGASQKTVLQGGTNQIVGAHSNGHYNVKAIAIDASTPTNVRFTTWDLYMPDAGVGRYACDAHETYPAVNFSETGGGNDLTVTSNVLNGGSCEVEVTLATADAVAGTFTATLIDTDTDQTYAVTEGAFYAQIR